MANADNIKRLEAAGVLKQEHFSGEDREVLQNLSAEEVEVLIRLRTKMGHAPEGKEHMRPNFVV